MMSVDAPLPVTILVSPSAGVTPSRLSKVTRTVTSPMASLPRVTLLTL